MRGELVALFRVSVSFRNMRAGETVEIPDNELGADGPWAGVMKWLRPVQTVDFTESGYVAPITHSHDEGDVVYAGADTDDES
jgi:hypothetical protein